MFALPKSQRTTLPALNSSPTRFDYVALNQKCHSPLYIGGDYTAVSVFKSSSRVTYPIFDNQTYASR